MKRFFQQALRLPPKQRGFGLAEEQISRTAAFCGAGVPPASAAETAAPQSAHGAVVIASITSCTNTSNPDVMIAAGLLARKAVERGLKVKPHVKTSLAPGSRVVTDYLHEAGLD